MGNCCADRKADPVFPDLEKERKSDHHSVSRENLLLADTFSDKFDASFCRSTATSESLNGGNDRTVISQLMELCRQFPSEEQLTEEDWVTTGTWIGIVDQKSAKFALKVALILQEKEFSQRSMVRFAFYNSLKQSGSLHTILNNIVSPLSSVRYCFARLLEVILAVFLNLTFSLVHDLLETDFVKVLEKAMDSQDVPEYFLCLSNILHCCYFWNLYVQQQLLLPSCYRLVSLLIRLFRKMDEPEMFRRHAENLRDFWLKHDRSVLQENFSYMVCCGLQSEVMIVQANLKQYDASKKKEIDAAEKALQNLLIS